MESPTSFSRYISPNSKKRVFLAGSSSSVCQEVEVLEISPPINRTSKPKQKEGICREIIDVDLEDTEELMLADGEVNLSGKGKEGLSNPSVGFSSIANGESGIDVVSNNGVYGLHDSSNVDDFSSDLFYGEDDWIDSYYDDILFDDGASLESQFDHMDIPPGVEAPFPWLPSSPGNDSKASSSSTSINASSQLELDGLGPALVPIPSRSSSNLSLTHTGELFHWGQSVTSTQLNGGDQHRKEKLPSKWMEHGQGQKKSGTSGSTVKLGSQPFKGSFTLKHGKEVLQSLAKSKRKTRSSQTQYPIPVHQFPQHVTNAIGGVTYPPWFTPINAPGAGHFMSPLLDFPQDVSELSMFSSPFMQASTFTNWAQDPANDQNDASSEGTSMPSIIKNRNLDEILQNFESFKKFDTVEDYSDHHYSKKGSSARQPPKNWAKRIQEEWRILEKDLPDKIFVRVYESRMDLLRAVIIGAEGTPYHDGLFFFDVFFPNSYPNVPPHVHYHSGGLRINPNLYECGKVCLSLLNTWSGSQEEKWIPGVSTMLQVLVSIQGLILNAKPYFNEPSNANAGRSVSGEKRSFEYNERTFIFSLRTMVYSMRRPPKYFEDFVIGHFCKCARDILVSCKAYLDGAQVGCLVKGGVQDVDAGDKSCSLGFKTRLSKFITTLVKTFSQIGAKDCEEFLLLAHKESETTTAAPRPPNHLNLLLDHLK